MAVNRLRKTLAIPDCGDWDDAICSFFFQIALVQTLDDYACLVPLIEGLGHECHMQSFFRKTTFLLLFRLTLF